MTIPVQERPWQRVGTDLFFWEKKTYLLIVNYFLCYFEVSPSACKITAARKEAFNHHGIPDTIVSDNGPHYSCKLFSDFSTEYGFIHVMSPEA